MKVTEKEKELGGEKKNRATWEPSDGGLMRVGIGVAMVDDGYQRFGWEICDSRIEERIATVSVRVDCCCTF